MRAAIVPLMIGIVAGCTRPAAQVFAVQDVYVARGDFEGSALVRVDPRTLQPLQRRGLQLGDGVTTRVLSPDGRTLAFGGYNFGEVFLVELARPTRATRFTAVPGSGSNSEGGMEVDVESWPQPSRLIAIATSDGAWWAPHSSQLVVIDPSRRRVVRRTSLGGSAFASVSVRDGTSATLVVPSHGRFPTLVVAKLDGSLWRVGLRRLGLGGRDSVRLKGVYYRPEREPALATDGLRRVFVVASDRPIADVDLRSRNLRYHSISLTHLHLSNPPASEPGTGGVSLRFATAATWLGNGQLAIGGLDESPALVRGFGVGIREADRMLEIVDTRSWQRTTIVPAVLCQKAAGVTLCSAVHSGFKPDGKGARGSSLVAYSARWRILYRKRSSYLWWGITAGRLFAGAADGTAISELDPRTGRVLRRIVPPPLSNEMWPLDLIAWKPPSR